MAKFRETHAHLTLRGVSRRLTLCLMLTGPSAFAAEARGPTNHYALASQPLKSALTQLGDQSGLQIVYPSGLTDGLRAQSLFGAYTPAQALDRLLHGTALNYRFTGPNSVTIERVSPSAAPIPPPPAGATSSDSRVTALDEMTVTAKADPSDPYNKEYVLRSSSFGMNTDTPIMETPLNVQTVSKGIMKDQQAVTLKDVFRNVSGVSTRASGLGALDGQFGQTNSITLRGFQASDISRNGVRQQNGAGVNRQLANVESVDVLKGPAAILVGLLEPGGLVNVNTKQPLATPYYGLTQQAGSYDFYRTALDFTGPLNKAKDLLYRVNLSYENSGSYRDFVGNEDVFVAPSLKWIVSPKTQINFDIEYEHQHQALDMGYFVPVSDLNTGLPILDSQGNPPQVPLSRNYHGYNPGTTQRILGAFNWTHQFNDDWTLKHRFSVENNQVEYPQISLAYGAINNNTKTANFRFGRDFSTYNTTLNLTGHFDTFGLKHTLLTGGDYYREDTAGFQEGDIFPNITRPANVFNPVFPLRFVDESTGKNAQNLKDLTGPLAPLSSLYEDQGHQDQYGFYIQDQIKLPYDVHVSGGIRYQYIHQNIITSGQADDAVTPRVGIVWQAKPWLSFYASYVESFGANSGLKFVAPGKFEFVKPTSAENYEGGIKTEFFSGKLRATLSYFDLTKTNVPVADPLPGHNILCDGGQCLIEIGAVRSRGPELDIQGEILPGWNVIANWSNTDVTIVKTDAQGNSIDYNGLSYRIGDRLAGVPRNVGNLWSTYEIQSGDFQGLKFGGGLNFVNGNTTNFENGKLPGYITADLIAGYSRKLKDVTVSFQLNVENLFDKRVQTNRILDFNGVNWFGYNMPRTFMGQVSVYY